MKARENLKLKTKNLKLQNGFTLWNKEQALLTFSKEKQTGFTLIELVIYIGLLMVMLLIFTEILTTIIENQIRSTNTSNVADDGRYIYSRLIYDIGRADAIIEPINLGDTSTNLILQIDGENYTYTVLNGDITITDMGGSHSLNGYGTEISNLQFTKVGAAGTSETVQIKFTITSSVDRAAVVETQHFQTTVGLR